MKQTRIKCYNSYLFKDAGKRQDQSKWEGIGPLGQDLWWGRQRPQVGTCCCFDFRPAFYKILRTKRSLSICFRILSFLNKIKLKMMFFMVYKAPFKKYFSRDDFIEFARKSSSVKVRGRNSRFVMLLLICSPICHFISYKKGIEKKNIASKYSLLNIATLHN